MTAFEADTRVTIDSPPVFLPPVRG